MGTDTSKKPMSSYTVYTPTGDWRGICARSETEAKLTVCRLTSCRVHIGDMTAEREGAR